MLKRTDWLDRKFPVIEDNGLLPSIIERLDGTAGRLYHKFNRTDKNYNRVTNGTWSINKEIGHLLDLEPLWKERVHQLLNDEGKLKAADMSNRRTHETDHDAKPISELIREFESSRNEFVTILKNLTPGDLEKTALHPRLQTQMRIIDLAFFVAEHDDHHLVQITMLMDSVIKPQTQNHS